MIVSAKIAILPAGISCTNGYQIDRGRAFLEKKFHTTFKSTSSFFKYLFQDPRGAAKFLDLYVSGGKKLSLQDLAEDPDARCPYLPETGTFFVHHEPQREIEEAGITRTDEERLANVVSKFNYLLEKFRNLRTLEKRFFIFGNTDVEPLTWPRFKNGLIDWKFSRTDVEQYCAALDRAFPEGENVFIFVTSPGNRIAGLDCCHIHVIDPANDWQGDDEAWDQIFLNLPETTRNRLANRLRNEAYLASYRPRESVYDAYSPEIKFDSKIVKKEGPLFVVESRKGVPLWGPYIRLMSGLYEASMTFVPHSVSGEAIIDLYAVLDVTNPQAETVKEARVTKALLAKDGKIKFRFTVGDDLRFTELRLKVPKRFKGVVERIAIEKL